MKLSRATAALLLTTFATTAIAAPMDTKRELAEKVQQSRQMVSEAEIQKRKVLGNLYVINKRMKKINKQKSELTDELFQVEDNAKSLAKLIAGLEAEIEKQRVQLKRRLRAIYKLSGEGYIAMLFSRTSSADLDESLRFLKIVTDADYRLIRSYQENIANYNSKKTKLKGQVNRLMSIQKNIKQQEKLLATEHKAKSKIVSDLDRSRVANLDRLKTLRTKTKDITSNASEWEDLLKASIFERRGQLPHPVQGTVAQDFGLVTTDKYKIRLSHKGWTYQAAPASPVAAIFDGIVAHSAKIPGYGHTVVIDHGDHYYSVYSHISRVRPKTGDTLKIGETFAETSLGERLYFEIRHFSEPENPATWIARKPMQKDSVIQVGAKSADLEETLQ